MTEETIQLGYIVATAGLLFWGSILSLSRVLHTVSHRRPVFWVRFVACFLLTFVFVLAGIERSAKLGLPPRLVTYSLEFALLLVALSYIATAKLDKFEIDHAERLLGDNPGGTLPTGGIGGAGGVGGAGGTGAPGEPGGPGGQGGTGGRGGDGST